MIRVSLTTLIFIYLALFLNSVFFLWLRWNWRRARLARLATRHRLRCVICAFEFSDETAVLLPRCPRCGSLNERSRVSSL